MEVANVMLHNAHKENKRAKVSAHLLIYSFLCVKLTLGFGFDFEFGLGLELGLEYGLGLGLGLG